jgi:hypothetical protein
MAFLNKNKQKNKNKAEAKSVELYELAGNNHLQVIYEHLQGPSK